MMMLLQRPRLECKYRGQDMQVLCAHKHQVQTRKLNKTTGISIKYYYRKIENFFRKREHL